MQTTIIEELNHVPSQPFKIETIEQMSTYIEELQCNASNSIGSALNAQLQVIRYVNSPDLVNSTFDLLFKNLQISIRDASTEEEKHKIRELSQLMIHNYIFFANAKLEFSISRDKAAGQLILKDATRELLKSAVNVIKMGESSKNNINPGFDGNHKLEKNIDTNSIKSHNVNVRSGAAAPIVTGMAIVYVGAVVADFVGKITENGGIWDRTMDWTFAKLKNRKDKKNFILVVENIINKLDKYHHIIGKSNLMSDIIDRYSANITQLKTQQLKNEILVRSATYKPILFILTFLTCVTLLFVQAFVSGYNDIKGLVSDQTVTETSNNYPWLVVLITFALCYVWISLPKFRLKSKIQESENRYSLLSQKFMED